MSLENDFLFIIMSIAVLIISSGLAFGILTSLLINDKRKGYFFIGWIALGALGSLIVLFRNYSFLAIVALLIYTIFAVVTFFVVKKKIKKYNS